MKTKINISNLKKTGIVIAAGLVLTTAAFAGSTSASNEERVSANQLDAMMTATEQSVRFVAPAVEESEEVYYAMEALNTLADNTEKSVKYVAPAIEDETVASEMESLNALAETIESKLNM